MDLNIPLGNEYRIASKDGDRIGCNWAISPLLIGTILRYDEGHATIQLLEQEVDTLEEVEETLRESANNLNSDLLSWRANMYRI